MKTMPKERSAASTRADSSFIPLRYQHWAAMASLVLILIVYFAPLVFEGKTFVTPDNIASHSWDTLLKDAKAEGVFPLWNPYIFCGMPGYGSLTFGGERTFDLSARIFGWIVTGVSFILGQGQVTWVLFYYFAFAIGMYVLIVRKVESKLSAFVGALAATFSMYIIIWIMVGHNTKIATMAWFPWTFLVLEQLRRKFDLRYAVLLVLLIHFSFLPSHVQMVFYSFLAYGVYLVFFLVREIIKKGEWKAIVRTGIVFAAAVVVAFAMDSDKYLSVLEYNPYSMRGSAPIVPSVQKGEIKTQAGGLDYDYATSWSLGVGEVMTFFVPSWYGFGDYTYDGQVFGGRAQRLNTYFGPQPFTQAPQYMGIVVLVLAIIGFWRYRKDPFVQYLGLMIVLALLVAFGKEFPLVYDLMFKYVPTFNKFRIPSMILVLVQIFVPVLAAYGVASFLKQRNEALKPDVEKKWKYVLYGLAAFMVVAFIGSSVVKDVYTSFVGERDAVQRLARSYGNNQQLVSMLFQIVADRVAAEVQLGIFLLLVTFGALFFYVRRRLNITIAGAVVIAVVFFDLWHVNRNSMDPKPFAEQKDVFTAPDYVQLLKQDTTLYRTLMFENGAPPYDNTLAYWRIQSAYGYQGAKMRAYQDMVDVAGLGNPLVWQLMNVKYIISNQPDSSGILQPVFRGQRYVYQNRAAAPRAFFVNRYEVAKGLDILEKMRTLSFNPTDVAYAMDDPKLSIDPPREGARAEYVKYGVQDLEVKATATGNNLLFLSEAYYPQGWKAYVDGKETPILRLDYLFRGVVVPQGEHTISMKFEPKGFMLGKEISLGMNIVVIGALLFFGVEVSRKWRPLRARPH